LKKGEEQGRREKKIREKRGKKREGPDSSLQDNFRKKLLRRIKKVQRKKK